MTGLHHMTNAIDSQLTNLYDGTILWPMIGPSNIAQGSAVLAMSDAAEGKMNVHSRLIFRHVFPVTLVVTEPDPFRCEFEVWIFPLIVRYWRDLVLQPDFSRQRRSGIQYRCRRAPGNPFY